MDLEDTASVENKSLLHGHDCCSCNRSFYGIENCYEMFPSEISWTLTIIGSFGAAANFVTIYILAVSKMKIAFKTFLIGLTVFDLISCSAASFSLAQEKVPALLAHFLYWLFNFGMSGSIWFTVLVTLERYTCVCTPFHHKNFWTKRKIISFLFFFFSLDFLVNLPLGGLFMLKHLSMDDYINMKTKLLNSWSVLLLVEFALAVCIVAVLNALIYKEIRRKSLDKMLPKLMTVEDHRENLYTNLTVMGLCVYICLYIYPTVAILRCPQSLIHLHKALSTV